MIYVNVVLINKPDNWLEQPGFKFSFKHMLFNKIQREYQCIQKPLLLKPPILQEKNP